MKVIRENMIQAVTADNEDPNFPAVKMIDNDHPNEVFRAAEAGQVKLRFTISGVSSGIALHNTNATGVVFDLVDPNAIAWDGIDFDVPDSGIDWQKINFSSTVLTNLDGVTGAVLCEWDEIDAEFYIDVTLTQDRGELIYVGTADGGKVFSYPNIYGLLEDGEDLSIVEPLSNGSVYIEDRDYLRIFEIPFKMVRDTEFHSLMGDIVRFIKSRPRTWMVTCLQNSRWLVYARIDRQASGEHIDFNRTEGSLRLKEVV